MAEMMTCGTCLRTWDDSVITGVTPVPAGRCPFEYEHMAPEAHAFLKEQLGDMYDASMTHYPYSLPMAAVSFTTEGQLRRAVMASGSHFFDRATMRAFSSRLAPGMIGGRFFITSEVPPGDARTYRVRWVYRAPTSAMLQVGDFKARFGSLGASRTFARNAHKLLPFPATD